MDAKTVIIIIVVLLLLYVVMTYVLKDANTMTSLSSGTTIQNIQATNLAKDPSGLNQSNFAYSIWYFIDDWNYNYNVPKILFARSTPIDSTTPVTIVEIENALPCPAVVFTPNVNNLEVHLNIEPTGPSGASVFTCGIENVPIQKWTNVIVSVYGRSLDIYLDGKLVKTCPLVNTVLIDPSTNVAITPNGGFSGWTSKFSYYPNALNPQQVWDIYSGGFGASWLSNLFGKYSVKIAFLENGTEDSSFTF